MNTLRKIVMPAIGVLAVFALQVVSAVPGGAAPDDVARSIAPYFRPATSSPKAPDSDGFLQRWLLLEPIDKPNRTNTVFTDSYVRNAIPTGRSDASASPYRDRKPAAGGLPWSPDRRR